MFNMPLAREVFVCVCPTDVPATDPHAGEMAAKMRYRRGTLADLDRLDPDNHKPEDMEMMRERFADHYWLLGEVDDKIVTYTWLHQKDRADYGFLPGCEIHMDETCGYGFDAWTPPELRGQGLRRSAFLQELLVLKQLGCKWEASFFVKHQIEGATRSLGSVGIDVIPLWKVRVQRDRSLLAEPVHEDPLMRAIAKPIFAREP